MTTTSIPRDTTAGGLARILIEGYGPGAWHGPDLKAALADVPVDTAFRRPAPGRHNVAEIALHHAYCVRAVRAQLTGTAPEPFPLEGEDWFTVDDERAVSWRTVLQTVEREQQRLADAVAHIEAGGASSPLAADEVFKLALGITCHAVYHAGQVQLVKRMLQP